MNTLTREQIKLWHKHGVLPDGMHISYFNDAIVSLALRSLDAPEGNAELVAEITCAVATLNLSAPGLTREDYARLFKKAAAALERLSVERENELERERGESK